MNRQKSVIAVAGGTGRLGQVISETLLTAFKPYFSRVIILSREPTSEVASRLASNGADVIQVPSSFTSAKETTVRALKGVDVLINSLGFVPLEEKNALAEAAIEAGVAVYFPSEFGVDHYRNDFPGYDHSEWEKKRKHAAFVEGLVENASKADRQIKVISVFPGLFLEEAMTVFGPAFGISLATNTIRTLSSTARTSFTSLKDIALSVAQLSVLAMSSAPPGLLSQYSGFHSHVHIAGHTVNAVELAREVEAARRAANIDAAISGHVEDKDLRITVQCEDCLTAKQSIETMVRSGQSSPHRVAGHLRVLMGEGKLDFSAQNENELVNPGSRLWRWMTAADLVHEKNL